MQLILKPTKLRQKTAPVVRVTHQLPMKEAQANARFEKIRANYRPKVVKVLLVGESRPANETFFYIDDTSLLSYTRDVFSGLIGREFASPESFLTYFRKAGYFLDDLCIRPVNNMDSLSRRQAREKSVSKLAIRIKGYSPLAVICIMKSIEPQVRKAVYQSGIQLTKGFHCVPFPSMGNQRAYQKALKKVLGKIGHF